MNKGINPFYLSLLHFIKVKEASLQTALLFKGFASICIILKIKTQNYQFGAIFKQNRLIIII